MTFMATHSYLENMSSEESNSEEGTSTYKFNTVGEVCNVPSDKLCDVIKMLSR